ncbi:hypothetical protein JDV02_004660 [Purpureocillium takamizusanense]|uniref:Condensation domain-containing protein n=1 Tax=Purpureocillium takamizusanense TaxID=2060973 RepID=A0A9Q8QGC6_9HYPO|nr:uncharacterized protein JDV02_004660 [Purpureocillium takamizusanense]UNI18389.1 hypothetical protein JDV02_004660 [Purpureocillium takamizusanense]
MSSKLNGLDREASEKYWIAQLHDAKQGNFPPRRSAPAVRSLTKTIALHQSASSSLSPMINATVLRAAWAMVLARYCDTDDVCFGASVSGPESMSAPVVVPVRLRLEPQQTVAEFLRDVRAYASGVVPHEQFGLQDIIKLSEDARVACDFASLLVIHTEGRFVAPAAMTGCSLVVHALLRENHVVEFSATYDSGSLADTQVTALSHHFNRVVQQLLAPGEAETLLRDISLAGPWDVQQATVANRDVPEAVDDCQTD